LEHFKWFGELHKNNLYFYGTDTDRAIASGTSGAAGTLYAVYDFLENVLGVRWIWPGETGEHIPPVETIFIKQYSEEGKPRFRNSVWRTGREGRFTLRTPSGWKSQKAWKDYHDAQDQ